MKQDLTHAARPRRQASAELAVGVLEIEFLMLPEAGQLFKDKRIECGYTQAQAAVLLRVGQPTISRLEQLPGQCRLQTVLRAMALYGMQWQEIRAAARHSA